MHFFCINSTQVKQVMDLMLDLLRIGEENIQTLDKTAMLDECYFSFYALLIYMSLILF